MLRIDRGIALRGMGSARDRRTCGRIVVPVVVVDARPQTHAPAAKTVWQLVARRKRPDMNARFHVVAERRADEERRMGILLAEAQVGGQLAGAKLAFAAQGEIAAAQRGEVAGKSSLLAVRADLRLGNCAGQPLALIVRTELGEQ